MSAKLGNGFFSKLTGCFCFSIIACLTHSYGHAGSAKLKPIVIVPGMGGSRIEAKLDRNETSHYWCYRKTAEWFTLWLNIEELLPMARECWIDNIQLVYNPLTDDMENAPGVETRVPHFGNTSAIEMLDHSVLGFGVYFYPLIEALTRVGYTRGENVRGAPYDFRHHPGSSSAGEYFVKLKKLIEDTYAANNGAVLLLSHSMGAPYTHYFLKRQSQQWKDKYIDSWVTISGAYAGSVNILLAYISGYGFGIPRFVEKPRILRSPERTYGSLPYLLPDSRFWDEDEILVETENRSYVVGEWNDLFMDLNFPLAKSVLHSTPPSWDEEAPHVDTYCLYGSEVETPAKLKYRPGYFPDYHPDIEYESGDGTVPLRSLEACKRWVNKTSHRVAMKEFPNADHNRILRNPDLIRYIFGLLNL